MSSLLSNLLRRQRERERAPDLNLKLNFRPVGLEDQLYRTFVKDSGTYTLVLILFFLFDEILNLLFATTIKKTYI